MVNYILLHPSQIAALDRREQEPARMGVPNGEIASATASLKLRTLAGEWSVPRGRKCTVSNSSLVVSALIPSICRIPVQLLMGIRSQATSNSRLSLQLPLDNIQRTSPRH